MFNAVLAQIHQVLVNLVRNFNISQTYVDEYDPWLGILAAEAFTNFSTTNRQNFYSTDQLIFGRDIILPIEHTVGWKLIHQQK